MMKITFYFYILVLCAITIAHADSSEPVSVKANTLPEPMSLPEPMTLEYALSLASESSQPNLIQQLSQSEQILAQDKILQSSRNLQVNLKANAWVVEPSNALSNTIENRRTPHILSVEASKVLYDFGRLDIDQQVFSLHEQTKVYQKDIQKRENHLQILNDFFNVLLADFNNAYHNEALAMAFIRFDRAKTHYEQKKISELDLLALENRNFIASDDFFESGQKQRLTRSKLAQSINRPGQLSENLIFPNWEKLPNLSLTRKLKPVEELVKIALSNNRQVKLLNHQIKVLKLELERSKLENSPSLSALFSGAWHARELSGGDQLKLGVQLKVPLYQGGAYSAKQLLSLAKLNDAESKLSLLGRTIEQELLSTTQKIVQHQRRDKRFANQVSYDELYLDKNRIEYEYEFKSDLGNAMVNLSKSQMQYYQNQFDLAYQWAVLDSLIGNY